MSNKAGQNSDTYFMKKTFSLAKRCAGNTSPNPAAMQVVNDHLYQILIKKIEIEIK